MCSNQTDVNYEYKAKKYHYKIQNEINRIMKDGKACPPGYEMFLQPFSNAVSYDSADGSNGTLVGGNNGVDYRYKAKKYHHKIQKTLRDIMNKGGSCPCGYEKYLQPFSENANNGNGGIENNDGNVENVNYEYKAKKYHYKIQNELKKMMRDGKACPLEYNKFLQDFQA
jgi:major membrane immunogen (membrane-anchored lipoprotein)